MKRQRKKGKGQRSFSALILVLVLSSLAGLSCSTGKVRGGGPLMSEKDLAKALLHIAARHRIPALAAALIDDHGTMVSAAAGKAVDGEPREVGKRSLFNIGSTTKPMTAILIGSLVAEGKLRWDTTLAEALPDIRMRDEYKRVTIHDLLLSRGGIIAFQRSDLEDPVIVEKLWNEIPRANPLPREQRRVVAELALNLPPIAPPGTKSIYSNVGWAIAGHIAEIAGSMPYEELVENRIFGPLDMSESRIGGWPADAADPFQPRGHYPPSGFLGRPRPQPLDDPYTFPAWMNPSGGINCTIDDYARFALECLKGLKGEGLILDEAGYAKILSVQGEARLEEMYQKSNEHGTIKLGYGWGVLETPLSTAFFGDGSGGTFYARIGILPGKGLAFVSLANAGNAEAAITDAQVLLTGPYQ